MEHSTVSKLQVIYSWNLSPQMSEALKIVFDLQLVDVNLQKIINLIEDEVEFIKSNDVSTIFFYNKRILVLKPIHLDAIKRRFGMKDRFREALIERFHDLQNCQEIGAYIDSIIAIKHSLENEIDYPEIKVESFKPSSVRKLLKSLAHA